MCLYIYVRRPGFTPGTVAGHPRGARCTPSRSPKVLRRPRSRLRVPPIMMLVLSATPGPRGRPGEPRRRRPAHPVDGVQPDRRWWPYYYRAWLASNSRPGVHHPLGVDLAAPARLDGCRRPCGLPVADRYAVRGGTRAGRDRPRPGGVLGRPERRPSPPVPRTYADPMAPRSSPGHAEHSRGRPAHRRTGGLQHALLLGFIDRYASGSSPAAAGPGAGCAWPSQPLPPRRRRSSSMPCSGSEWCCPRGTSPGRPRPSRSSGGCTPPPPGSGWPLWAPFALASPGRRLPPLDSRHVAASAGTGRWGVMLVAGVATGLSPIRAPRSSSSGSPAAAWLVWLLVTGFGCCGLDRQTGRPRSRRVEYGMSRMRPGAGPSPPSRRRPDGLPCSPRPLCSSRGARPAFESAPCGGGWFAFVRPVRRCGCRLPWPGWGTVGIWRDFHFVKAIARGAARHRTPAG